MKATNYPAGYEVKATESYNIFEKVNDYRNSKWWENLPEGVTFSNFRDQLNEDWERAVDGILPLVGRGCTICYYSDRRAATITKVEFTKKGEPKAIEVMHNEVRCKDYYAGDYEVLPELCEHMGVDRFTRRRNGRWIMEGHESRDGVQLMLHYQSHYIDPSF